MTTDIRKALGEKARIERDKAVAKEEAARKALLEVSHLRLPDNVIASLTILAVPVVEAWALLALMMVFEHVCPVLAHCSARAAARAKPVRRCPLKKMMDTKGDILLG